MIGDVASKTQSSAPQTSTGYRVSLAPGALEVCARLGTPEEVRNLVKVLRAAIALLVDIGEDDFEKPLSLTKRVAAVNAASKVVASPK